MKSVDNVSFNGKKVLVRVDYNVPQNERFKVTNYTRIERTINTLRKITEDGGVAILISHMRRPKGKVNPDYSLSHITDAVSEVLGQEVFFVGDVLDPETKVKIDALPAGSIAMLENIRFHAEEEKGDVAFAKAISTLGDMYVNDAFGAAHREHASTATIVQFFPNNAYAGYLLYNEVHNLEMLLNEKIHPFTAIVGGSKVSTKIKILNNLIDKVDHLIIGGGMSYTFLKAQGFTVGNSLCEDEMIPVALEILAKAKAKGVNLHLPCDHKCGDQFSEEAAVLETQDANIANGWIGLDIGAQTIQEFNEVILASKTILWNGPVGVFEMDKFGKGTKKMAEAICEATAQGAYSLVGGGDSIAALGKFDHTNDVSYVSTGGGAMLQYLEGEDLPGIKALEEN